MKRLILLLLFLPSMLWAQTPKTDAQLKTQSDQIRNAVGPNSITPIMHANMDKAIIDSKANVNLVSTVTATGTDAYAATVVPPISVIPPQFKIGVKFQHANTGAATITFNGTLGPYAITKDGATALNANDIKANALYWLMWDSTRLQLSGGAGGGASFPVADNTIIVKNVSDNTKQGILDASLITTGTTRTAKLPDANIIIARSDAAQTFTGVQTFLSSPIMPNLSALDGSTKGANAKYVDDAITSASLPAFDATHDGYVTNAGVAYKTLYSDGTWLTPGATGTFFTSAGSSSKGVWSTSTIPSSAGATANKVLLSNGTNYVLSTPTFPNASATSGKIVISDGTNWIASTPTFPAAAGTTGNVLTSNGTNWTSAAPTGGGGVTNSAAANELMKSDGTNAVASGLFSTTAGNVTLGTGLSGTTRTITFTGSGSNVGATFVNKGTGGWSSGFSSYSFTLTDNGTYNYGAIFEPDATNTLFQIRTPNIGISLLSGEPSGLNSGKIIIKTGSAVTSNTSSESIYLDMGSKTGSGTVGNLSLFSAAPASFGAGQKVAFWGDATANPSTDPTGGGLMFSKSADHRPYWRTPAGVEYPMTGSSGGDLAAVNNLSDVADPDASFKNLGGTIVHIKYVNNADYTILPGDFDRITAIYDSALVPRNFTVANGLSLGAGSFVYIRNTGTADITIVQDVGQTVRPVSGALTLKPSPFLSVLVFDGSGRWSLDNGLLNSDAKANAATKGISTYVANDFNDDGAGLISLDYTNGQASDASHKGFVTSSDWTTFNNKLADNVRTLTYIALGSAILAETVGVGVQDANTAFTLVNNTMRFTPVYLTKAQTLTGVKIWTRIQGSYTANNNNRIGLYTYSGGTLTLVASCANDGNLWQTAASNALMTKAFSSTYAAAAGLYYVGLLYCRSAETTAPQIVQGTSMNNTGQGTLDFTNSAKLFASLGAQTDLPSSTTMAALTANLNPIHVMLY